MVGRPHWACGLPQEFGFYPTDGEKLLEGFERGNDPNNLLFVCVCVSVLSENLNTLKKFKFYLLK